jgi:uncharacterized membrane protein
MTDQPPSEKPAPSFRIPKSVDRAHAIMNEPTSLRHQIGIPLWLVGSLVLFVVFLLILAASLFHLFA